MSTILIVLVVATAIAVVVLVKFLEKKKDKVSPIKPAKEPIVPTQTFEWEQPIDEPVKPLPVNCKYAQFKPAPEEFFYVDCCGKPEKGEGFQPWEKRVPVAIDINKPFSGMDVTEDEAFVEC